MLNLGRMFYFLIFLLVSFYSTFVQAHSILSGGESLSFSKANIIVKTNALGKNTCSNSLQNCTLQIAQPACFTPPGSVTITNKSLVHAKNITASSADANFINYVVQTNQCPALLPPGASCTISFATNAPVTFLTTNVMVKGSNTNATYVDLNAFQCALSPTFTSINNTTFIQGAFNSFTITATGVPAPTFSITSGSLPIGVTLDPSTGVISGTPTTLSSYAFTITASNGNLPDAIQNFTLTVNPPPVPPAITSANSTTFTQGTLGTFNITATGTPAPTFSITSGSLPTGVTLNSASGVLSGTPTVNGVFSFEITAANGAQPNATQHFTLTVEAPPVFTSASSTAFAQGSFGTFTVTAAGTPAPTYSVTSGSLPSGVTLNSTTGVLSGTPLVNGVFAVTFTATNGVSPDATQNFTLTVTSPPTITSANAATFTETIAGTFTITASGTPASTFSVSSGSLPAGVTLNGTTGILSGTPTVNGTFPVVLTAANGISPNATQNFTLTVNPPPVPPAFTSASSATFTETIAGSFTVAATGTPAPTFSVTSGSLPTGVTLDGTTGILSGTPTVNGVFAFTITATNGASPDATQNFTLTVKPTPNMVYVTNSGANSVSAINGANNTVSSTIPVTFPLAIAINSSTNTAYVMAESSGPLSIIDVGSNTVSTLNIAASIFLGIAVNPVTNMVYITDENNGRVYIVDGSTNTLTGTTISVGSLPNAVAVNSATNTIYVTNTGGSPGTVSVIDGTNNTVTTTINVGNLPVAIAVNETTNTVYVTNQSDSTVSVIDGSNNTVTATINVGASPEGIDVNATTNTIYASSYSSGTVSVIQGTTVTNTINGVGGNLEKVAVNAALNMVYVASASDKYVTVIDGSTNSIVTTVPTELGPYGVAVYAPTPTFFFANNKGITATVVDTVKSRLISKVLISDEPSTMAVNKATNAVYAINYLDETVMVTDRIAKTIKATIKVGHGPKGILFNPVTNKIYVVNQLEGTVSIIDGSKNTVIAKIPVNLPQGIALNPSTHAVYVANKQKNRVSIIDGKTNKITATLPVSSAAHVEKLKIGANIKQLMME